MRYQLICYDLPDGRQRDRVAKLLLRYGKRVQESVFEIACASESQEQRLQAELKKLLTDAANVRCYRMSAEMLRLSSSFDHNPPRPKPSAILL
jgi:CRISPR-associated protein Cas2